MSSQGVKEYTLKINGVAQSIRDVTKLEEAVRSLDERMASMSERSVKVSAASKGVTKSLTEEEKAQKKLADTVAKTEKARSGVNDEQIRATQALREATREATRRVQIEQLEEGSVKRLGMELTDLRNEYYNLSKAERENAEVGGEMLARIQKMDAEYKAAKESAGQFQDSVGNYERATEGLGKLADNIGAVDKTAMGVAQSLLSANTLMAMFGDESEENSKRAQQLQKLIMLLTVAEQLNNGVLKQGIIQQKAAAVADGIRAVQIKAKTAAEVASTKGTLSATIAQKAFNVVAMANPYVLLAMAIVGIVAGLAAFASSTETATEKQKRLNEEQSAYLDGLELESSRIREASEERVAELERQIKVLEAQGGKQKEIRAIEDRIAEERRKANRELREANAKELADLDANKQKLKEAQDLLQKLNEAKAKKAHHIDVEVGVGGKGKNLKKIIDDIDEEIENAQKLVDNLGRSVKIGVELKADETQIETEARIRAEQRKRQDAATAKEIAKVELDTRRAAEDAKLRLLDDANEKARRQMEVSYDRQVEDLRKRLSTETNLSRKARESINETILSLEAEKEMSLDKLVREQAQARAAVELELTRQIEDQKTALILGEYDRQRVEINAKYDRQIEDLRRRLETDKLLTEEAQHSITQLIEGAEKARQKELTDIGISETEKRTSLQLAMIDDWVAETEQKIGAVKVRDKEGMQLIDVEATRKNLADSNTMLAEYVARLTAYRSQLEAASDEELAGLQEGTPEYEEALLRRSAAMQDLTSRIRGAQKQQEENTKESAKIQQEYYQELYSKLSEYADMGLQALGAVTDTITMALQAEIDELNEQLDAVNERYDEAQKRREDSVARVEQLEADLQNATGGTAEALKSQLQEEMANRAEAEREELRLAKEKERREAQLQKKERQMKRADMVTNIAQGLANTALGVTQALASSFPPLNFIMAALVGTMGAIQTGIMIKQLAKMADGGLIEGPSHAQGGARILGTNIEVEGGEFVVNKASTAANSSLVRFINDARGPVTLSDLAGIMPGDASTVALTDVRGSSDNRILEAIDGIDFRPVVAVTDIIDRTEQVTEVRDLAGFS